MTAIHSMTGYGRAHGRTSLGELEIEMRSVNHKSFDLNLRSGRAFSAVEPRIRERIRETLERGRVDAFFNLRGPTGQTRRVEVDRLLARRYKDLADAVTRDLKLSGALSVDTLLSLPDVIYQEEVRVEEDRCWKEVSSLLDRALKAVVRMRAQEGRKLVKDVRTVLGEIGGEVKSVRKLGEEEIVKWRETLKSRVEEIAGNKTLDPGRLEQEVAFVVSRSDIQEELIRLESHLDQFRKGLSEGGCIGRQFDFLCQEMNREVNTMGSKALSIEITNRVIKMKGDIEKIREQIQNLK